MQAYCAFIIDFEPAFVHTQKFNTHTHNWKPIMQKSVPTLLTVFMFQYIFYCEPIFTIFWEMFYCLIFSLVIWLILILFCQ